MNGIVTVNKTDTFTLTSTTFTDLTGLSADITLGSTDNKVLIMCQLNNGGNTQTQAFGRITRNGTVVLQGDAGGNRTQSTIGMTVINISVANNTDASTMFILDSPASTSTLTYQVQVAAESGNMVTINRSGTDSNAATINRSTSTLTLLEVII